MFCVLPPDQTTVPVGHPFLKENTQVPRVGVSSAMGTNHPAAFVQLAPTFEPLS